MNGAPRALRLLTLGLGLLASCLGASGAGVTLITHGYNGDVNGWVTGMADEETVYPKFPGTNFTEYTIVLGINNGSYTISTSRTRGIAPLQTQSGEIIVKLDWSQLAGGVFSTYSTYAVAGVAASALLQTNLITELGGRALVELPLHLVGHSRGGSLISEVSRILGTNGVWVDHLTTLDPHPLNNDGFSDPVTGVDAPVRTYVNVLFHDNYWQDLGGGFYDPTGEPVAGAYIRQLTSLSGGYGNTSSVSPYHSNVHLWYHGTIQLTTPASDTEASIGTSERSTWWVSSETKGTNAGFIYSLIGGANRLSTVQPLGPGFSAIRDGYNQYWDLGAGVFNNRITLASNSGTWPSLIKLNRTNTAAVAQGQSASLRFYYQWAKPGTSQGTLNLYLDDDFNPLNTNGRLIGQLAITGTGANAVNTGIINGYLNLTNAPLGRHWIYGKLVAGGRTRYLYAPESINVLPPGPPTVDIAVVAPETVEIGINGVAGEQLVLQTSLDLSTWQSIATNTLSGSRWTYTVAPATLGHQYFRASKL